jgi:hypothetical protein
VSRGGEDDICRFETFSPERGHAGPLLGVQSYRVWASRANMDILVLSLILPENILIVGPVRARWPRKGHSACGRLCKVEVGWRLAKRLAGRRVMQQAWPESAEKDVGRRESVCCRRVLPCDGSPTEPPLGPRPRGGCMKVNGGGGGASRFGQIQGRGTSIAPAQGTYPIWPSSKT